MKNHTKANPQDRFVVSDAVKRYLSTMMQKYPSTWMKLKDLRSTLANDYHCLC